MQEDGIVEHPERRQPYTVWFGGHVVLFAASKEAAEAKLEAERKRADEQKKQK